MTATEKRRYKTAQAIAKRLRDRPTKRIHAEYEAWMLEQKWGVAHETCEIVCSLLKGAK